MTVDRIKRMLDACYLAKRIRELLPEPPKGEELSDKYDKNYYSRLLKHLDTISDEEADCTIQTIEKFYQVMRERRVDIE